MSAQGLLSSVFSCSLSPKTLSKRRLRHTKSLDPAWMSHDGSYGEEETSVQMKSSLWKKMTLCCGPSQPMSRGHVTHRDCAGPRDVSKSLDLLHL
ncbi:hypothetical protein EYF80_037924 [Liparis tanakae]|uniref:Uncharacterized protein n=1 Tax=Liparis tanakae TaxID=230148 RepID=A0A4Z2GEC4_9TELE|nr:hypothetical protein EYF80_037924 [Liparis tanakae]